MVVVPAYAHAYMAQAVAPYIKNSQVVVINPGSTGGALEFYNILRQKGKFPVVCETSSLLYACRKTSGSSVIAAIKKTLPIAAFPGKAIDSVLDRLRKAFPQLIRADSVLYTSLNNLNPIVHPLPMLTSAERIENGQEEFSFYGQGITPSVARVIEKLDSERINVAASYGQK